MAVRPRLPDQSPDNYRSRCDVGIDGIWVTRIGALLDAEVEARKVAAFSESTFGLPIADDQAWQTAQDAVMGKGAIPNSLESVSLTFEIGGISRTTTHQIVRTRVGAGFGQHGMRTTPAHRFNVRFPESFARMVSPEVLDAYDRSIPHLRQFYQALLDAGVPYQDARFVLPMGTETHLVATYNLLAAMGFIRRRSCNRMQWEIGYVVRRMHDIIVEQLPWVGRTLRSSCESGVCQTIDPMFEPSCMFWDGETVEFAVDHPALAEANPNYNWPRQSNGNWALFKGVDATRLWKEGENPDIVMSMVDGGKVLSERVNGRWQQA